MPKSSSKPPPARQPRKAEVPPLARAQSAGSEFSGVAASRVAGTTRDILNAVSFPRFVTELINGVFKADGRFQSPADAGIRGAAQ